jgi:CheY-like chemotaxis protein
MCASINTICENSGSAKTRYTALFSEYVALEGMKKDICLSEETEPADGGVQRNAYRLPRRNSGALLASLRDTRVSHPHVCKGRVLIMDDQEIVRSILSVMLLALGYETHQASNGDEAIACYTTAKESGNPFDAVLIDLNVLNGMGGREAMRRLLEIDPEIRAVVTSGDLQDPAMEDFGRYGFSGVLLKPYAIGELRRVMKDAICGDKANLSVITSDDPGNNI